MSEEERNRTVCKICGKKCKHLGAHLWHAHGVLAREYKEEFGLPFKMSLISKEVMAKKSEAFEKDREKYIKNLAKAGAKYQFKKGQSGYRRVSEYEMKKVIARINDVNAKKKSTLTPCPVCNMQFNHMESHLFNKHGLIQVKNGV